MSDLHFGTNGDEEAWNDTKSFLRDYIRPSVVLICGDIVDSPSVRNFERALRFLESLPEDLRIPYFVCSGNHDRFSHGNAFHRLLSDLRPGIRKTLLKVSTVTSGIMTLVSVVILMLPSLFNVAADWQPLALKSGVVFLISALGFLLFPWYLGKLAKERKALFETYHQDAKIQIELRWLRYLL